MKGPEMMLRLDLRTEEGSENKASHSLANYRVTTGPDGAWSR